METGRKGLCINVGNCKNADSKLPIEVSVAADFICPECGRDLVPIEQKRKMTISKPVLILGIVTIVLLGGSVAGYYLLNNDSSATTSVDNTKAKTNDASYQKKINEEALPKGDSAQASSTTPTSAQREAGSAGDNTSPQTGKRTTPSSPGHTPPPPASISPLQSAFDKLADPSSYSSKDNLLATTLSLFTSNYAKVYTIGQNGSVVSDMPINDFLETMRTRNKHFVFIDGVSNEGKYSSIRVKTN